MMKEFCLFGSRSIVTVGQSGERSSTQLKDETYTCHCFMHPEKIAGTLITDGEYPSRVAFGVISRCIQEFLQHHKSVLNTVSKDEQYDIPQLQTIITKYQKPHEGDKIMEIQKNLDDTKGILVRTIDQMLERGEKLETLVSKSEDLSFHSKAFLKKSEKLNKCCIIL